MPPPSLLSAAQDALGDAEAAARALTSALGVDAPTEASEVAELATLASKVLASVDGDQVSALVDAIAKVHILAARSSKEYSERATMF